MNDRNLGLFHKYTVDRIDGKPTGPCIVLSIEDPNSWPALLTFVDTVEVDGYKKLAIDLRELVKTEKEGNTHG